jgi:hypothetical protein
VADVFGPGLPFSFFFPLEKLVLDTAEGYGFGCTKDPLIHLEK